MAFPLMSIKSSNSQNTAHADIVFKLCPRVQALHWNTTMCLQTFPALHNYFIFFKKRNVTNPILNMHIFYQSPFCCTPMKTVDKLKSQLGNATKPIRIPRYSKNKSQILQKHSPYCCNRVMTPFCESRK